jgi:serine/threonine protein kinase
VYINSLQNIQELKVYQHLEGFIPDENTIGKPFVRQLQASFNLKGPYGDHQVLVMKPLGMSLRTLQEFYIQKDKVFEENLVTGALDQVLLGLDYLHEAKVIHTGGIAPAPNALRLAIY